MSNSVCDHLQFIFMNRIQQGNKDFTKVPSSVPCVTPLKTFLGFAMKEDDLYLFKILSHTAEPHFGVDEWRNNKYYFPQLDICPYFVLRAEDVSAKRLVYID